VTIFGRKDGCARYRPALTDWVEHRVQGPSTPSAFDHLARCRRCERELTDIAQTIIALRRLAELTAAVEPPSDGWPDLRARLDVPRRRSRPSFRVRGAMIGSMLGPAVVAVLVMRVAVSAPIATVLTDDGASDRSVSTRTTRPMYDSGPRSVIEDDVTIRANNTPVGDDGSTGFATRTTTARPADPSADDRAASRIESSVPRSATRSLDAREPSAPRTSTAPQKGASTTIEDHQDLTR
jgi:hypothetical protein